MSSGYNNDTSLNKHSIRYTKHDTSSSLVKQIDNYYTLKMEYDAEKTKIKNKISSNNNSVKEKQKEYKSIVPKCVSCKRVVGMVFEEQDNLLIAQCGATSGKFKDKKGAIIDPCSLNISINRPDYYDIENIIEEYGRILSKLKKDIKILKLNHLYQHIDDDDSLSMYQNLIKEYESYSEIYASLQAFHMEEDNKDKEGRMVLKNQILQLHLSIIEGFKSAEDSDDPKAVKRTTFGFYNEYLSLIDKERENKKYKTYFINDDDYIGSETFLMRDNVQQNEIII